jgi:hypothetical protein
LCWSGRDSEEKKKIEQTNNGKWGWDKQLQLQLQCGVVWCGWW